MKRALSLDVLRGLSIFGMVLAATIPFGGALPAWMYHAQCPPPTHAFNPQVAGITWVDLVLPVFIFCMGAAIPLAFTKKIAGGASTLALGKSVASRFFSLVIFAIYIAHILPYAIGESLLSFKLGEQSIQGYDLQWLTLVGFGLMFPMFRIIKDQKRKRLWRIVGWGGAVALLLVLRLVYGQEFSLHRSNIIILLLANVYLLGAVGWYFTRNSWVARAALFVFWGAVQLACKYTGFDAVVDGFQLTSWFFLFRMSHYMLLIIPATAVGDMLVVRLNNSTENQPLTGTSPWKHLFFPGLLVLVVGLTTALFQRWILAAFIVTPLMLVGLYGLVKKHLPNYQQLFGLAAYLIVIGLIIEPVEGGIKKDYATASYMILTSGMALCLLMFFDYVVDRWKESAVVKLLAGAGCNPLMAYVVTSWFVFPFLKVTFLYGVYEALYPAGLPWLGALRAVALVIGAMSLVYWMAGKKIIWRV
ncbi:DUF5009 domain-containing protein [Sunxiuqinia rutila]|uniref:DUF5009 domain-containing protein n=1 Tax=Sunxiuqinia rutila TaxID=1397841 RepID=UPI003D36BFAD